MTMDSEYRWHDLRTDPHDLPRDMEKVQICWLGINGNSYDVMFWNAEENVFSICSGTEYEIIHPIIGDNRYGNCFSAVAWRRIEPYESSKGDMK